MIANGIDASALEFEDPNRQHLVSEVSIKVINAATLCASLKVTITIIYDLSHIV